MRFDDVYKMSVSHISMVDSFLHSIITSPAAFYPIMFLSHALVALFVSIFTRCIVALPSTGTPLCDQETKRSLSPRWCPGDNAIPSVKPADPSKYRKICYSDLGGACLVIHRESAASSSVYLPSSVMDLETQFRGLLVGTGMTMRLLTADLEKRFPKAAEHRNAAEDEAEVDEAFNDVLVSGIGCVPPLATCIEGIGLLIETWGLTWMIAARSCPIAGVLCNDTLNKLDKLGKLKQKIMEKEKELEEEIKKEKEAEPAEGAGGSGGDKSLFLDPGSSGLRVPPGVLLTNGHGGGGWIGWTITTDCPFGCEQM